MNRAEKRRQMKLAGKAAKASKPVPTEQPMTIQQAIDLGMQHQNSGDLPKAESIYQQILLAEPKQPVVLHLLGVIAHQVGKNDIATDLIGKALAIKPNYAEAYSNLGNVLKVQGKLDDAVASYHKAITIKSNYAEAYSNLGNALKELGRLDDAVASYHKALTINPDFAEAYYNLGNALQEQSKLDDAVASYHKALTINPDFAEAYYNLGNALQEQSKLDDAVASYHKALAIKPDYAEAHSNLGNALQELGRLDDAVASYHKAIAIKPDYAEAHSNLGLALQELGNLDDAVLSYHKAIAIKPDYADAHYNLSTVLKYLDRYADANMALNKALKINYGGPWWNAQSYDDTNNETDSLQPSGTIVTSPFKLHDNADQLEYLITKELIDPSFQKLSDRYRTVLAELQDGDKPDAATDLTQDQLAYLGSFYNKMIHYGEAPRIESSVGTINSALDFEQIEDRYLDSPISVVTLDDFLTPTALQGLRDFCLESTIYFNHTANHFVRSRIENGFNCDLLDQITQEVQDRFPRILGDHCLTSMWSYRYNNQSVGVAAHTDQGAVTFNFWITPNEANLLPEHGGLIVYTKEQPSDWNWRYYNTNKYDPSVSREIEVFLSDAESVTIPYRENRAVLFHSNLFHKSDHIHFKDGYENRRINITMLFGYRRDIG